MRRSALLVSVCALVPAACGGSTTTSATSTHPGRPSAPAAATTPATTITSASGSAKTKTTAATPKTTATSTTAPGSSDAATTTPVACTTADLALSYLGQQGATGHGELGFALHNITGSSCHTFGYPGVQFLDRAGQLLPTESTRTTQDFFGNAPEEALVLAPGESASFRIGVTHGAVSPQNCTTAYGLQVIAPDDTVTMRMPIPGGAYECRTATVSPLRPDQSAYP
jgi:Protein of unknown function (DUF4232)